MAAEKYAHKILIVEDDKVMFDTLVDNLIAAGFAHLYEAHDGEKGLEIAVHEKPDLILLDIIMPRVDGMTMLKRLREVSKDINCKVIILTNLPADDTIMNEIVADQPSYYLVKSDTSISDVIQKIKIALGIVEMPV